MAGKYTGFAALKAQAAKNPKTTDTAALAASIGRKKGKRITEDDPRWNPRTMGNHRGSKGSKTAPFGNGEYRPT